MSYVTFYRDASYYYYWSYAQVLVALRDYIFILFRSGVKYFGTSSEYTY